MQVSYTATRHSTQVYMDPLSKIVGAITDALHDAERLPGALMLCGVLKAAAALYLVFFKTPGGVFVAHNDDKVLRYLYYSILVGVVIFGFTEASAGFWVSGDPAGRRAVGMTILWVSILPLVFVAACGGFAFAAPR